MNFKSANKYLSSFISYERFSDFSYTPENFDLRNFRNFLKEYKADYSKLKFVHIAGSKGKGTTANLTASYLHESGFKTGLFTSPHLFSVTERIKINGMEISEKKFCEYVADVKKFFDENYFKLTYFEILTAIAFKFFIEEKVDYVVLEVGLGGRLDSTNVVMPQVCALTTIEMEHVGILGNNLSEILNEKLGIYKKEVPFIVGPQKKNIEEMIKKKMRGKNLEFINAPKNSHAFAKNSVLAKAVIEKLLTRFDNSLFEKITRNFKLPGHFDVRKIKGKTVVFDVAHTKESFKELIRLLKKNFPKKEFVFLISLMRGKDVKNIGKIISKISEKVVFTSSNKNRGYTGNELCKILKFGAVEEDLKKAFDELFFGIKKNQILVTAGSHFLVGSVLKDFTK